MAATQGDGQDTSIGRKKHAYTTWGHSSGNECGGHYKPKSQKTFKVGHANITIWNSRTMKYILTKMREDDIKIWGIQEHHLNPQQLQAEVAKLKKKHYKVHALPAQDMHNRVLD